MKSFVITLNASTERQKLIQERLSCLPKGFEFLIGVDARTEQHPLLERYRDRQFQCNMGRPAAMGEIGCYASHFLAWQKCVELNEPVIIFEDDLNVDAAVFLKSLEIAKQNIAHCGYIRLENADNHDMFYQVRTVDEHRLVKYLKIPQCMTGYAISPETARAFIKHSLNFDYPVDVFLRNAWIHKQTIFGFNNAGLWGGNLPSVIGDRKRKGSKNYYFALMKLLNKARNMVLNLATNIYHLFKLGREYRPSKFWIG
ncbi:glycosyltransferase family 25 protein [Thaumasiovibrio sp. DFM-14]|uniref:glycosyltransferase family 25 protein n=1 Tax=Thaumasiovibrio sp. DFM-14 TaxID=3384792 RepID=UPI00399FF769